LREGSNPFNSKRPTPSSIESTGRLPINQELDNAVVEIALDIIQQVFRPVLGTADWAVWGQIESARGKPPRAGRAKIDEFIEESLVDAPGLEPGTSCM
jgi:hypothetical protein